LAHSRSEISSPVYPDMKTALNWGWETVSRETSSGPLMRRMTMSVSQRSIFPLWEFCDVLGRFALFRFQDSKAAVLQQLPRNPQHQFVVLDQQDHLAVAARRLGLGFDRQGGSDFVFGAGQLDFEGRAAMRLAMDPDAPACLLRDPVHGSEAQAGALAYLLGGEERMENVRKRGRIVLTARTGGLSGKAAAGSQVGQPIATTLRQRVCGGRALPRYRTAGFCRVAPYN
jgi:hypothetical protein